VICESCPPTSHRSHRKAGNICGVIPLGLTHSLEPEPEKDLTDL